MLIEHSFITTMEAPESMGAATSFLNELGFRSLQQQAFQVGQQQWNDLEMQRGKRKTDDPTKCEQKVRLEFDRGRVTVAATISPSVRQHFRFSLVSYYATSTNLKPNSKLAIPYCDLMIGLSWALEDLLARQTPLDQILLKWKETETSAYQAYRKRHFRQKMRLLFYFVLIFGLMVVIAISTKKR